MGLPGAKRLNLSASQRDCDGPCPLYAAYSLEMSEARLRLVAPGLCRLRGLT